MALTNIYPYGNKNYIINGNFDFWQRVEGNTTTVNNTSTNGYTADRFQYGTAGSSTKNFSIAQSTNVPTAAQSGYESTYSYLLTVISALSSFASNDVLNLISYRMEGYDLQRIWGKNMTFGFWISASVPGTYSFALNSGTFARSYVTTFTVSAANTWQFISITVPPDTTTTGYNFNNTIGMQINIASLGGSSNTAPSLNTWVGSGQYTMASGATNYMATAGATIYISQVSLTEGPYGYGQYGFQRAGDTISEELRICQRYYEKSYDQGVVPGTSGSTALNTARADNALTTTDFYTLGVQSYKVTKRTAPTVTIYSGNSGASGKLYDQQTAADVTAGTGQIGTTLFKASGSSSLTTGSPGHYYYWHWTSDCDL